MTIITNTAQGVLALVEQIAATASKKEKEALVKQGMSLPLFAKTMIATYDRFKVYGFAEVPNRTPGIAPGANTLTEMMVWTLLDCLADGSVSGNNARNKVQSAVDFLDEASSTLFRRILLKDMRAGFTENTVNKAAPGTFAEYPYMRCSLPAKSNFAEYDWANGIISQEKADGSFANVNKAASGVVSITTRTGTLYPAGCAPELEAAIGVVFDAGTQSHGELLVFKFGELTPREIGNGVLNRLASGGALEEGEEVRFYAWDQIPLSEVKAKGKYEVGYKARLVKLLGQFKAHGLNSSEGLVRVIDTRIVKSKAEAYDHYRELLKKGKEGTICKALGGIWKDGTSKDQVKLKLEAQVELKVVGFNEGGADTDLAGTLGSFICRSECEALEVNVNGRTRALRDEVWADRAGWLDAIITVKANSIMKPEAEGGQHSLFLPVFIERRTDKTEADSLQRVRDQFEAAVNAV